MLVMPSTAIINKYKKKPVVIEAVRFCDDGDAAVIAMWCDGIVQPDPRGIVIHTLEGDMLCKPGDWVIKGVAGEFYPCVDSIFRQTYDSVVEG